MPLPGWTNSNRFGKLLDYPVLLFLLKGRNLTHPTFDLPILAVIAFLAWLSMR